MSHEITLRDAREHARQAELINRIAEEYPSQLSDNDAEALATLTRRLLEPVCAWLDNEKTKQEELGIYD